MLKKYIFFIILFFIFIGANAEAAQINDFSVDIAIKDNSELLVKEIIVYDFGAEEKHGIFRVLPYRYQNGGKDFKLRYSDISVADENGQAVPFVIESKGNEKRLKIGDQEKAVSGIRYYAVQYAVRGAFDFSEEGDKLYWNVTGNGWQAPIAQSRASIVLPQALAPDQLEYACYSGAGGTNAECVSSRLNFSAENQVDKIVFSDDYLRSGESASIAIGLPKGTVKEPSIFVSLLASVRKGLIPAILLLAVALSLVFLKKRKKKSREA